MVVAKPILKKNAIERLSSDLSIEERIERIIGYKPSAYQKAIIQFLLEKTKNGACNAVAGSGKSSTLMIAAIALAAKGVLASTLKVLVFGKANAKDLQTKILKLGRDWKYCSSTLHSVGYSLLRKEIEVKIDVQECKYRKIARERGYLSTGDKKGSLIEEQVCSESEFLKLVDLVRLTNQTACAEVIRDLAKDHEIEAFEFSQIAEAIVVCLQVGKIIARTKGVLDYTDMIWLPVLWQLDTRPWFRAYEYLFVDECQDLNQTQLTLALMLSGQVSGYRGKAGRIIFVGDPAQAIMGFAGADCNSYSNIVDQAKAVELPLSTCYRCPSSHIRLVRYLFPHIPIEPRDDAPVGSIQTIGDAQLKQMLKTGDMVLSRKTAPLVRLCIRLIADGVRAAVKGRNIGETLKRELENITKLPGFHFSQFSRFLGEYGELKAERYKGLENYEQLMQSLSDRLDALEAIYQSQVSATSVVDLATHIDSMFADNDDSPITLSTVHRSKGLEGKRIFLLKPDDLPLTWKGQQPWQLKQEENLLYVALTRSTSELFFVGEPSWLPAKVEPDAEVIEKAPDANVVRLCEKLGVQTVAKDLLKLATSADIAAVRQMLDAL
ncbi:UvrD-helicase domain-containing protein [cf. Phormidesmis sp. LEGE 11477]|uniref:UvrD-helicase domain-containing protein n=1 Tax=cf. Phormidesmis sp. LEGE 11477 TaxID=1828680 RepID=UPI00188163E7|nr:UvrD-helicase domain-containing protein [cf. Phormidesmis sp. LEGE 11477]MBE9064120.1 ATP-dependent helicase [cf. Phormidesmis sp. LEGE 11477]